MPGDAVRSQIIERLPGDDEVVALTIDVERDDVLIDHMLDTLADRGVTATFGVTGTFARAYPHVVERIADAGHLVMSHSDAHRSFTGRSSATQVSTSSDRQADLFAADATLRALIGRTTAPYWRPPYGDVDAQVLADAGAIGYSHTVLWTVDSLGWAGLRAEGYSFITLDEGLPA